APRERSRRSSKTDRLFRNRYRPGRHHEPLRSKYGWSGGRSVPRERSAHQRDHHRRRIHARRTSAPTAAGNKSGDDPGRPRTGPWTSSPNSVSIRVAPSSRAARNLPQRSTSTFPHGTIRAPGLAQLVLVEKYKPVRMASLPLLPGRTKRPKRRGLPQLGARIG